MRNKILGLLLGLSIPLIVYAGLETGTYIDSLVVTNPLSTDPAHQGDDHLRLIKTTIKNTLPNINAAVTASDEELNVLDTVPGTLTGTELGYVDGVTSAIQTQINTGGVNITGKAGTAKTLSTSDPSGGSDGDIWYKR